MAFLGVFLVAGAMSVALIALLSALIAGVLLWIAALAFALLNWRKRQRGEAPERWQRIAATVCALLGTVLAVPPVVIYLLLLAASH